MDDIMDTKRVDDWLKAHKHEPGEHDQKKHGNRGTVRQDTPGGRAEGGVVTVGINQRKYAGGQFLPNTEAQAERQAKRAAENSKKYMDRKQEIAPYVWDKPPDPLSRSIYPMLNGTLVGVRLDRASQQFIIGPQPKANFGGEEWATLDKATQAWKMPDGSFLSARDLIERYNTGVRWLPNWYRSEELRKITGVGE